MKKRILGLCLALTMLIASGATSNLVAYAGSSSTVPPTSTPTTHEHSFNYYEVLLYPTEGKEGLTRYYCDDYSSCKGTKDEATPRLPNVYVSKFLHDEGGLCTRITAHQRYQITDGELNLTMDDWNAKLIGIQYNDNWQDNIIKSRAIEFKARDVGVGYFNDKVDSYSLTLPLRAVNDCRDDAKVVVYLTTGAAIIRLSEDATSALVEQTEENFGVVVSRNGDEVLVKFVVDGEAVNTPDGVEMLYWVKDAGDKETAPEEILMSNAYKNFELEGDFDLIFVESGNSK